MRAHCGEDDAGQRLDHWLARQADAPRNQVQRWIRDGKVWVDGRPHRRSYSVQLGDEVSWQAPEPESDPRVQPEPGDLEVLWEDDDLIFVYKPPGLVVHPGAGHRSGTLVNHLLHHYPETEGIGGPGRPGIVHRLDRDTSGVMVLARSERAYRTLSTAFAERRVGKTYLAAVYGITGPSQGTIEAPIARHPQRRQEMAVVPRGRPAVTHWRRAATTGPVALWALGLETGRTHQIRVHCRHVKHPLVGDPVYGERRWKAWRGKGRKQLEQFPRPALHAWILQVPHPDPERDPVRVQAEIPEDLRSLWRALGNDPWPEDSLAAEASALKLEA
ncbi:MAG: RluA family pseudouridine synthase [Acidobacteriota bacterium]